MGSPHEAQSPGVLEATVTFYILRILHRAQYAGTETCGQFIAARMHGFDRDACSRCFQTLTRRDEPRHCGAKLRRVVVASATFVPRGTKSHRSMNCSDV